MQKLLVTKEQLLEIGLKEIIPEVTVEGAAARYIVDNEKLARFHSAQYTNGVGEELVGLLGFSEYLAERVKVIGHFSINENDYRNLGDLSINDLVELPEIEFKSGELLTQAYLDVNFIPVRWLNSVDGNDILMIVFIQSINLPFIDLKGEERQQATLDKVVAHTPNLTIPENAPDLALNAKQTEIFASNGTFTINVEDVIIEYMDKHNLDCASL